MKKIIISEGDPAGISYEILEKSRQSLELCSLQNQVILVRSQSQAKLSGFTPFSDQNSPGLYEFVNHVDNQIRYSVGTPTEITGKISYHSLKKSVELQKKIGGNLITLPLSKEWVIRSGVSEFRGHTEFLAKEYKKTTIMVMWGEKFSVIPLTTHIPLKNVLEELKKVNFEEFLQIIKESKLCRNKSIAFLGLNPHAGEHGKIGNEEIEILEPFVCQMKKNEFTVIGPLSADSAFLNYESNGIDIYISCYHDQGLIPFKLLVGKNGINFTLGLNFIRVSPDHGTAFDIAGKNLADCSSFIKCIEFVEKYGIN